MLDAKNDAVHATDEQVIALWYLMQISAYPAFFLHQTCTVCFVKHLSPYTGCISEWIWFTLSLFCQQKNQ